MKAFGRKDSRERRVGGACVSISLKGWGGMRPVGRPCVLLRSLLLFFVVLTTSGLSAQTVPQVFRDWKAGSRVSLKTVQEYGLERCFEWTEIPEHVYRRMLGKSFKEGTAVGLADLRYVRVLHYDGKGAILLGELVCNRQIAADLVEIFRALFNARYPIERMVLIDDFNADDELSMRANNTSAFCYRAVAGSQKLSAHARGMAVDINPLYNPYYRDRKNGTRQVRPATAIGYCDRSKSFPYKLVQGDLCHRLFLQHGFQWGGSWRSCKDFQHFEK